VNTIAMPAASAASITAWSFIEPPGWITAVAPASTAAINPSAKGKNASDATTEPFVVGSGQPRRFGCVQRLARGDARRIHPAHLAGANAHRRTVLHIDDSVRLHVLGHLEGEFQISHLGVVG
jgi:hypothetical protein